MKWLAALALALPALVSATVPGIDVSHYQGSINWGTVKANGVQWAYIKATEGTSAYRFLCFVVVAQEAHHISELYRLQGP